MTCAVKIKNYNTTKPCADAFQASFPHKLSLPAQLVFPFRKVTFIILKNMSLFRVAAFFIFVFKLFLKTARTNKQSLKCPTVFFYVSDQQTRPIRLPLTEIHSCLLAQPQSLNLSPQFTTPATDIVNLSLSKLSEHFLFLSQNMT